MYTFFVPPEDWNDSLTLEGQEHLHFKRVLRGHAGQNIRILDGAGREAVCRVKAVESRRTVLELQTLCTHPEPEVRFYLAPGWNKSLRRTWLLEKAAELGCDGLLFWQAARSQGTVPKEPKTSWTAQVTAGAKQSVNPFFPKIKTLDRGIDDLIGMRKDFDQLFVLWEGEDRQRLSPQTSFAPGRHLIVLGPEGGLLNEEVEKLLKAGFAPVSLGQRILRWETAALLCLSIFWWAGRHHAPGAPATDEN
ncbi:MAG: 16S rRNA (uracil(1498)-N(3))-methyltransferase [Desulfovibrionales bacterium]